MKKVVILSGVSGSGKSTLARKLWNDLGPGAYCKVVSADDYFVQKYNGGREEYKFDPTKLSNAHGACFKSFNDLLYFERGLYDLLIVDNTNTTAVEIAPYILGAQAFECEVEIITVRKPSHMSDDDYIHMCTERNKHGVGFSGVQAQYYRLRDRNLPPWWKNTDMVV